MQTFRVARLRRAVPFLLASALVACGGNGTTTPAGNRPPGGGPGASGAQTSYSVSAGTNVFGETAIDLTPSGLQSTLSGADFAPGATVVFPDGSTQTTNAQGTFDASASTYAATVRSAFIADSNRAPRVMVYANDALIGANGTQFPTAGTAIPAVAQVAPYAGSGSTSAPVALNVFPRAASVFTGGTVTFSALARDVGGDLVAGGVSYTWTLAKPPGCGFPPAGQVIPNPGDPSKARYIPPGTGGDFPKACPDLVVATATVNGASVSAAGAVSYFDKATGAQISGQLASSAGAPGAGALLLFDAAGTEAYRGTFAARASASGGFRGHVPYFRPVEPLAYVANANAFTLSGVAPSVLQPSGSQNALTAQTWTYGTAQVQTPPDIPDVVTPLSDALFVGLVASEPFPFGGPPSGNGPTYPSGSLENVVRTAAQHPNATGTVTTGPFTSYTYVVDSAGKTVTAIVNPNIQSGAQPAPDVMLQVTQTGPGAFAFTRYLRSNGVFVVSIPSTSGARLDADGSWTESVDGNGLYTATMTENRYLTGQQQGSPYAVHRVMATAAVGSTTEVITDQWSSGSGAYLGTLSVTRTGVSTPASCPTGATPLFAYSGTLSRTYNAAGGVQTTYALGGANAASQAVSCIDNQGDHIGTYELRVTASPSVAEQGLRVDVTTNVAASGSTQTGWITGTVDSASEPVWSGAIPTCPTRPASAPAITALACFGVDGTGALTGLYHTDLGGQSFGLSL